MNNNDVNIFSRNLNYYMYLNGKEQIDLINDLGFNKSTVSTWCRGIKIPRMGTIQILANYFNINISDLVDDKNNNIFDRLSINNINPLPKTVKKPRLGTIACGEPILAEENLDGYDDVPDDIKCDFTLLCQGDSMINARINNGDIVYIRQQPTVDNGEIAAVLIDNEATLKRVYLYDDKIVLQPENTRYAPLVYSKEEMNDIKIIGKAVGFTSKL